MPTLYIDPGYWDALYTSESFEYVPAYGANVARAPRVFKSVFGDGYAQRSGDGINANPQIWSMTFKRITAELNEIDNYLEAHGGAITFLWTTPKNAEIKVICSEWTRGFDDNGAGIITAKFEQVFE